MAVASKSNSFNNVTEGATLSAANTGTSGDAIATPTTSGTGAAVAKAAATIRGARGVEISGVSGDVFAIRLTDTAAGSWSARIYFRSQSSMRPGAGVRNILRIRNSGGNACNFVMNTSGVVSVQNAAGTGLKNFNSNTALTDGWYYVNLRVTKGTTTSNGRILCTVRSATTDAIISDGDYDSGTTVNAGTTDLVEAQCGIAAALTGTLAASYIDEFAVLSGSVSEIDAVASSSSPVLTLDDNVALISVSGGTSPYTINQTAGTTTTPTVISSTMWSVLKHTSDTLTYTVTDAAAATSAAVDVPPRGATSNWPKVWNGSSWVSLT